MVKKITYCLIALVLTACDMDFISLLLQQVIPPNSALNNHSHGTPNTATRLLMFQLIITIAYVETDNFTFISVKNITTLVTALRNDSNAYFGILTGDLVNQKEVFTI